MTVSFCLLVFELYILGQMENIGKNTKVKGNNQTKNEKEIDNSLTYLPTETGIAKKNRDLFFKLKELKLF